MYRSWSQMKEGWTKNLALLFRRPVALAVFRLTECLLLFGNLLAAFVAWSSGNTNVAVLTISLGLLIAVLSSVRIRRAHFSWTLTLLALAGLPVFSYLLFRSAALHRNHGVTWKGRKYGSLGDADLPKHSP
jgi:hypothetical protein